MAKKLIRTFVEIVLLGFCIGAFGLVHFSDSTAVTAALNIAWPLVLGVLIGYSSEQERMGYLVITSLSVGAISSTFRLTSFYNQNLEQVNAVGFGIDVVNMSIAVVVAIMLVSGRLSGQWLQFRFQRVSSSNGNSPNKAR